MHSCSANGQAGHHDAQTFFNARKALRKSLCTHSISCIRNTDEVAVLYRSFPSRSIRNVNDPATYTRIKDRLTAVLTFYADGRKAPLTIIGKVKGPKSFPRNFEAEKDFCIFYKYQKNLWNTQSIWASIVVGFDKSALLGQRFDVNVLDSCSTHVIDYTLYETDVRQFLHSNMKSVLQPIDSTVGRSFKCAYTRLLVSHILKYVERNMAVPADQRSVFKLTDSVKTYDAFFMIIRAWDTVPVAVVLN